jgi:hypothetical protein
LCALCRRSSQQLRLSHFLPAGVYRVTRAETQGNPDPLKLTDLGVFQDSRQVSDYLLCGECEERLNKYGERWFLAHCWRRDRFLLASTLEDAAVTHSTPTIKVYHAIHLSKVDVTALTYFAASMFWRASVHRWKMAGSKTRESRSGLMRNSCGVFLWVKSRFRQTARFGYPCLRASLSLHAFP